MIKFLPLLCISLLFLNANILQETIDNAPRGATLTLPEGIYKGNIVIDKPLTIQGRNENVTILGEQNGSVVTINSDDVTLKNLHITASGERMDHLDAGITLHHVKHIQITDCNITDSLYGIDMNMVEDSLISNNYITSKKYTVPLRGDALKLWYANHNIIRNNTIEHSRDVTFTYAHHNLIEGNTFLNDRFALHLEMSHQNSIRNNTFRYNAVAILMMGIKDTNVTGNKLLSSKGAAGIAVVADKVTHFYFEHNLVKYNARAFYIDEKGTEKGLQRFINYNQFLYNAEVFHFHSAVKNNMITHNIIKGNIEDVLQDLTSSPPQNNTVSYNYWDRYEGFDRDHDNIGDTSHHIFLYADQLWKYNNRIKFFYNTPILSIINLLSRVAPFIEPVLLLEDTKPLITPPSLPVLPPHQ